MENSKTGKYSWLLVDASIIALNIFNDFAKSLSYTPIQRAAIIGFNDLTHSFAFFFFFLLQFQTKLQPFGFWYFTLNTQT